MLLAVDVGNTNSKFALFDGESLAAQWRLRTDGKRTADEYAVWISQLMTLKGFVMSQVRGAIIASVVPDVLSNLRRLCVSYFDVEPLVVGEPDVKLGVKVLIDRPQEAGADRLVDAIAGFIKYGGPLIVIDFGSGTTFEVVDRDGNFCGGAIAPGIELSIEAFYLMTARLPRIRVARPAGVIGTTTVSAMQSGIFWGYVGLIESLVTRIKAEFGEPMKVIATGGLASVFESETTVIEAIEPDLTLFGLLEILASQPATGMTVPGDELLFLPLGGAGEIGMNLNLYGCRGKWLMLDLGVTFADDSTPGLDVLMPDPSFIVERREHLLGIILTHAHEDHLGAVPDLWPRLRCPVYATPFAASILNRKLREAGLQDEVPVTIVPLGGKLSLPPFELEFVTMTHSIPEPNAVAIRTPHGVVLHTGDWKIDPQPLIGEVTDETALRRLGGDGVLAMVCDSTNVFVPGEAGSESEVRQRLTDVIRHQKALVAVTCFASNLARVDSVAKAAVAADRHPVLFGRALHRMVEAARENGYLTDFPPVVAERDAGFLPREKVCLICTGSQGEPRAALARLASGENRDIGLRPGDSVVFSSRVIPGNEKSIGRLQNQLAAMGVDVITDRDADIHVSGHPARDELARLYQWVRPRIAVPVHGERRHLVEHAALAKACQVPAAIVAPNGSLVRLAPGPAQLLDHIPTGRLARDGLRLVSVDDTGLRDRRKMLWNGAAVATLVLDRAGRSLAAPRLTVQGLGGDAAAIDEAIKASIEALRAVIVDLSDSEARDDAVVGEAARRAVRRVFKLRFDKKPLTDVQVVRI